MEEGDGETDGYVRVSAAISDLTLLCGYDSMVSFLHGYWEQHEKQSDDLANLLGSINRTVSGPPLDAAQWSDWLDAILSIQPNLESVRCAREQIQTDHEAFLKALKIQDADAQRSTLDLLRKEVQKRSWHIAGDEQISLLEAYTAVGAFLRAYWKRGNSQSKDVFQVIQQIENSHPAVWESWVNVVAEQNKIERNS